MEIFGNTRMPKALSTPMSTEASSAPHTEPIPPITTTTNASTITVVSITVVSATRGHLERAGEPGQKRAQDEHAGEEPRLVDAERRDHLAVLRGGADQHTPARPVEDEPEQRRDERAEDEHREVVGRARAGPTTRTEPRSPGASGPVLLSAPQTKRTASATTSTSAKVSRSWYSSGAR